MVWAGEGESEIEREREWDGNKLSYTCKTPNESWSEQQAKRKWYEKTDKGKVETPEMLENRVGNLPEI